ncbi:hypothetical protein NE172_16260 [Clostridium botulinum]|uniref:Uncharacterized protein n=1 Tax=Clostridium botulinum TaxID=1491 RepID=A0A6B4JPU9_CLOBO|nr:hypothetical protein [Clostridium botulinum]EES51283.1 hypothetical protein CLO_3491 [Clostridium botulinum E1 str. 'BoNT E Beluga']MBY6762531.1 hypothetical protein [Clostridium botulinum]MBY6921019.1 hypothetical protein [Clostridium botulinum]MCR1132477.1 hypothetical protein [Clostridium botulinum]NFJ59018.1 hypothetical protein [Clostridium botulinum]
MINFSTDKKTLKIICLLSSLFILILILLTLFFKNTELNKINKFSKTIITINSSLKFDEKDAKLNFKNTKQVLAENLTQLNTLDNNLTNLTLKKSNSNELKNNLSNYLKVNINLYNSIISIINNKNNENFQSLYEDLIKNEEIFINETDKLSEAGVKTSIPKNLKSFFISLNRSLNESYKSIRENDIISEQKRDFFMQINDLLNKFSDLKDDIKPALEKIREDNRDLSIVIYDLNEKRSDFNAIKDSSISISIPVSGENCYEALEEIISSYDSYINSLEKSIKNEMTLQEKSKLTLNNIDELYTDTFDKYDYFLSCFDNLQKTILSYKY